MKKMLILSAAVCLTASVFASEPAAPAVEKAAEIKATTEKSAEIKSSTEKGKADEKKVDEKK